MGERFLCPVCGYPELTAPPWDDESPSDEICPSCGTHFGYDDVAGGDAGRREAVYRTRRNAWQADGCPWFSRATQPSPDWDPARQLQAVER
jgi:hypothetical protein